MSSPHPRISVSCISSFSWSLDEDLAFWAAEGIDHVGISVAELTAAGLTTGVRKIADAGLRVSNLIGPGPFDLDAPGEWPAQRDRLRRLIDAADEIGAECLVLTTGAPGHLDWEGAADALGTALGPVLDHARASAVPVAFEHTNSLRPDIGFLHTLRDSVDLARRFDVGVCMETNACWLERGLAQTVADGVDRLRLVQVSDFVVGTHDTPNRAVPGDGDIPIERILAQVVTAGYEGTFDLELIGPRIEEEGYPRAIRRSIEALGAILESIGA
jgi:sugar phosphate isomerase/epimerase